MLDTRPFDDTPAFCLGELDVDIVVPLTVGAMSMRPEPRYTLTKPSPLTAEPSRLFEDFSTVN